METKRPKHFNIHQKSFIIILLSILSFSIGQFLVSIITNSFYPNILQNVKLQNELSLNELNILKLAQFTSALFSFVIPSFLCAIILYSNWKKQLSLKTPKPYSIYFLIPLLLILLIPFMNIIIQWNENIVFPQSLSHIEESFKASENSSKLMINTLLKGEGIGILIINILLVAGLPALGEELFFRGLLQSHFNNIFKNPHIGIFLAAILFSALHFQFYGFFPRLILGLIFGYLVYYSRSIWTAIIAHFFNNALAVVVVYFKNLGKINDEVENFGTANHQVYYALICFILAIFLTKYLLSIFRKQNKLLA